MNRILLSALFFIFAVIKSYGQLVHVVNSSADSGNGTLRSILSMAASGDTIKFDNSISQVNLTSGQLLIDKSVILIGNPSKTRLFRDTTAEFRILEINGNVIPIIVRIHNIEIANGQTLNESEEPQHGGGVLISGASDSVFMNSCIISGNQTGKSRFSPGGSGGDGGGIYNTGFLSLSNCIVEGNKSGEGQRFCFPGKGAGLFNKGSVRVTQSKFLSNLSGKGGDDWIPDGSSFGYAGGDGGAIYNQQEMQITETEIIGNKTGVGGNASVGYHGQGSGGRGGNGAAIYNSGSCILFSCKIQFNITGEGGYGSGSGPPFGSGSDGRSGSGAGIYNMSTFKATNCLITNNSTGDINVSASESSSGNGGGIYTNSSLDLRLVNSTISANKTSKGKHTGTGGGIYVNTGNVALVNTIVSGNFVNGTTPEDVYGTVVADYSLIRNTQNAVITGTMNLLSQDPQFMLDGYNFRLRAVSPAVNAGNPDTTGLLLPLFDIDKRTRILDARVDMGAYERQPAEVSYIIKQPDTLRFPLTHVDSFSIDSILLLACSDIPFILDSIVANEVFNLSHNADIGWQPALQQVELAPGLNKVYVRFRSGTEGVFTENIHIYTNDSLIDSPLVHVTGESAGCVFFAGNIQHDTIWQGCVRLIGNVTIKDQVKLSIKPGTRIITEGPYEILVERGSIYAAGNKNQKITFTGKPTISAGDTTFASWGGIRVYSTLFGDDTLFFEHCIIQNGAKEGSWEGGGAICLDDVYFPGKTTILNCIFRDNKASNGGAIFKSWGSEYDLVIINTVFENNSASGEGGAVYFHWSDQSYPATMTNLLFSNNRGGPGKTSAVYGSNWDKYTNCSFVNNPYPPLTGGSPFITNCLFWPSDFSYQFLMWPILSYNNEGMAYPDFVDTSSFNYRLKPTSNCYNAGNPDTGSYQLPLFDLDGRPRIADGRVDIGCYEYQQTTAAAISVIPYAYEFYSKVGEPKYDKSLCIKNTGSETLIIDSVSLPEGFAFRNRFGEWENPLSELDLNIYDSCYLELRFLPTENKTYPGNIIFYSNDPLNNVVSIPVTGHASADGKDDTANNGVGPLVYPVPSDGIVNISELKSVSLVEIYDLNGRQVFAAVINAGQESITIDLSQQPGGIYTAELYSDKAAIYRKIILK